MKVKIIVLMVISLLGSIIFTNAQYDVGIGIPNQNVPVVSLGASLKGRQGVIAEFKTQVDYVRLTFGGASLVMPEEKKTVYLWADELRERGYKHAGAFSELNDALASVPFDAGIIVTRDGDYDVSVDISYFSANGAELFSGFGRLDIQLGKDGKLVVSEFQPWVFMASSVLVVVPKDTNAAKWIGSGWQYQDLTVYEDEDGTVTVEISTYILSDGYFAIARANGNVIGWDLRNGARIPGEHIATVLGQTTFGDNTIVKGSEEINGDLNFYRSEGQVYGRVPLTELVLPSPVVNQKFDFGVNVWGSEVKVQPSSVFITPRHVEGLSGLVVGQEYEVKPRADGWFMTLPKGIYDIRQVFLEVLDGNNDFGGGKG